MDFIVNAKSLRKKNKNLLERITERMTAEGLECHIHTTSQKGDATRFAQKLCESGDRTIVVIGGDGMMNDVLSGIDPERCKLGLIPAGTGNDFAATANIPHGEAALDIILKGEAKDTDYLQFDDGRRSLNISGYGIDVDILIRCQKMKLFRGKCKYFMGLLATLFKYRGSQVKIEIDGKEWEQKAMIAAICNGKCFGGGIPLCPPAEIDDGKLELVVVDYPKRSKILGALIKLMKGKIFTVPFAHRYTCDRATITPPAPTTVQYDGELYEAQSLAATLVHGKLKMFRG